jgi:hypothetical protein
MDFAGVVGTRQRNVAEIPEFVALNETFMCQSNLDVRRES